MSACFFIGHRLITDNIIPSLIKTIEKHITEYGVSEFYVGHQGNFDSIVTRVLTQAKQQYPHIRNYLLLAYHPAIKSVEKPDGFESTLLLDGLESTPPRFTIPKRNQKILQEVEYLICYVTGVTNGSYNLLRTAKQLEKQGRLTITNLGDKNILNEILSKNIFIEN